jgi:tetratricopeptide (TPR) repeat protein
MDHDTVDIENWLMSKKEKPPEIFADDQELKDSLDELKKTLDQVDPEVLKEAQEKVKPFLEGDLSWLDLLDMTPEEKQKMAEFGYHQFQSGDLDKSEVIFKSLTIIEPENYYYHSMLGAIYQRKEMWPESVMEYSIAVNENPADIVSLVNRGEVYIQLEFYSRALEDLDLATSLDPEGKDPWGRRAVNLKKKAESLGKTAQEKGGE